MCSIDTWDWANVTQLYIYIYMKVNWLIRLPALCWSFVVGRGEFKASVSSWLNCWVISKNRCCVHSGSGHLWDSTRNQHGVGGAWPAEYWDGMKGDQAHRVHYTPCLGDSPDSIRWSPRDRWMNWLIKWLIDWLIDESMLNLRNRKFTQLFVPVPVPVSVPVSMEIISN